MDNIPEYADCYTTQTTVWGLSCRNLIARLTSGKTNNNIYELDVTVILLLIYLQSTSEGISHRLEWYIHTIYPP